MYRSAVSLNRIRIGQSPLSLVVQCHHARLPLWISSCPSTTKRWNSHQHIASLVEDDEDEEHEETSWKTAARHHTSNNTVRPQMKKKHSKQPIGRFTTPATLEPSSLITPTISPTMTTATINHKDNISKLRQVFLQASHQRNKQQQLKKPNSNQNNNKNLKQQHPHQQQGVKQQQQQQQDPFKDKLYTSNKEEKQPSLLQHQINNPSSRHTLHLDSVVQKYYQQKQQQEEVIDKEDDEDDYQRSFLQSNHPKPDFSSPLSSSWKNNMMMDSNITSTIGGGGGEGYYYNSRSNNKYNTKVSSSRKPNPTKKSSSKEEEDKIVELPTYAKTISLSSLAEKSRISIPRLKRYMQRFGIVAAEESSSLLEIKTKTKKKMPNQLFTRNNKQIQRDAIHIGVEEAELLLLEIGGYEIIRKEEEEDDGTRNESSASTTRRPPVVCIMGHVDHGKTTLLDALRTYAKLQQQQEQEIDVEKTNVNIAGTEAGGITQMISAFQITLPMEEEEEERLSATFLDTPGHAAFSRMRHCGIHATDVLVLVIAADDGVKEQTCEIINLISNNNNNPNKLLKVIVAMTKIDKSSVDVQKSLEKIENELFMNGIQTKGVGGDIPIVPVSGITSQGLDVLMEQISSSSRDLYYNSSTDDEEEEGVGIVLDARMEKGVGVVAECVVRSGQFVKGGYVVVERQNGRIRLLKNVRNISVDVANPSDPIRLIGLDKLPKAGESILCVRSEDRAQEILTKREFIYQSTIEDNKHDIEGSTSKRPLRVNDPIADLQITNNKSDIHRTKALKRFGLIVDNENTESKSKDGNDTSLGVADDIIRIPIIIKSDAHGTLHAIESALLGIASQSKHSMLIDPIRCGVGPINSSDIVLALESDAPIFAFNVSKDKSAASEGVVIKKGNIIYNLIDEAKEVFASFLPSTVIEDVVGTASVQAVYNLNNSKNGKKIAGCRITDGILFLDKCSNSGLKVFYRVLRGGQVVSSVTSKKALRAESLKKFKEDVTQIRRGEECGLGLDSFYDIREGDFIECFTAKEGKVFL